MHDIKLIRDNPKLLDDALARRSAPPKSAEILALDGEKRKAQTSIQELQQQRNELAKKIGMLKAKGEDASMFLEESNIIKAKLEEAQKLVDEPSALDDLLAGLPNILAEDVPEGKDESSNKCIREWAKKPEFAFTPKEHFDIGEKLGLMDFERASKLSGARFTVLRGDLARLERAIAQFMLNLHTSEFGYTETYVPLLVRDEAVFGTGQLPKFSEDLFKTTNGFWLIPTAEVSLTNLVAGEILDEEHLPLRFTAYSPCFRSEAGSAGKDTRGMLRQHQFTKVELVSITTPEQSKEEHERMTACAEEVLKRLGLAYRVMLLCAGDTGFCAEKTYDLEVWLPGQKMYREISSCSNTGAFQARRMKARCRTKGAKETRFVHTLNGSGLAVGRTLIAILENYQQADGSVLVPEALRPYMGGQEKIG